MLRINYGIVAIGVTSLGIVVGAMMLENSAPTGGGSALQFVTGKSDPIEPVSAPTAVPSASDTDQPGANDTADIRAKSLADVSAEISPILEYSTNLKSLHDKLRGEGRDANWAQRSERMLGDEYAQLAGVNLSGKPLSITCGTTLCEVSGDLSQAGGGINHAMMMSIQQPEVGAMMWERGYHSVGSGFAAGTSGHQTFVTYYRREAPVKGKIGRLPAGTANPGP